MPTHWSAAEGITHGKWNGQHGMCNRHSILVHSSLRTTLTAYDITQNAQVTHGNTQSAALWRKHLRCRRLLMVMWEPPPSHLADSSFGINQGASGMQCSPPWLLLLLRIMIHKQRVAAGVQNKAHLQNRSMIAQSLHPQTLGRRHLMLSATVVDACLHLLFPL